MECKVTCEVYSEKHGMRKSVCYESGADLFEVKKKAYVRVHNVEFADCEGTVIIKNIEKVEF